MDVAEHVGEEPFILTLWGPPPRDGKLEWGLWDDYVHVVTISDTEFVAAIQNGAVSYGSGDVLVCTVRNRMYKCRHNVFTRAMKVLSVEKHIPHPDRGKEVWTKPLSTVTLAR